MTQVDPRYPIGPPRREPRLEPERRRELISHIEELPARLRTAVAGLTEGQWALRYRDGGWTVRQVVHHLADSHMNAFLRFRLAVTEDTPRISPYKEALWAELPDVASTAPEVSIQLLDALHQRWVVLLNALPPEAFAREIYHPEHDRKMTLDELVCIYGWHCEHHLAHIREALAGKQAA